MANRTIESTLAILGGLGIGAAAMYLMDPKQGQNRRAAIASGASNAVSGTRDAAAASLHRASDRLSATAQSAKSRAAHYARDLADRVINEVESRAHDIASGATDALHHAADSAHDAMAHSGRLAKLGGMATGLASTAMSKLMHHKAAEAQDSVEALRAELADRIHRATATHEEHPVAEWTGHTLGTFGFLAIGAGCMYFLDPSRGRARRAWLTDKITSTVRRTGKRARGIGQDMSNRAYGYYAETRRAIPEPWRPGFMQDSAATSGQPSMPSAVPSRP